MTNNSNPKPHKQLSEAELMNIAGGSFGSFWRGVKGFANDWWYGMTHNNGVRT